VKLQNLRSLAEADVELSAVPVEVRATSSRSLALELLKFVGSGSLAGLAFGLSDLVRASLAVGSWGSVTISAALLGLWLWFGQMLGFLLWMTRLLVAVIKRRLSKPIAWHALLALVASALALVLARKVFAGSGIRRTAVGSFGVWLVPVCVGGGVWLSARLVARGRLRIRRPAVVCASFALAIAAPFVDVCAPGGYLYLHVLLLTAGVALTVQALDMIGLPAIARHVSFATSLLTLPSLLAFPASRPARELLAQPGWAGLKLIDYAQYHVDFDHDGHSPVFGGGDCDDADPSAFSGAPERPGDGRDSNCDGLDDPKPSTLLFTPFHTQTGQRARQAMERAKQFPTVVILVDALRFDRIGNRRFPNLASLAEESIRFSHVYSTAATTLLSVPAMMSGSVRPVPGRDNIAHSLARAGQSSHFIGPDIVIEHFQKLGLADPLPSFSSRESVATDRAIGWGVGDTVSTSAQMTGNAIKRLDSTQPPDLLWLHYFDLHQWNVLEQDGVRARGDDARYDAVLERLDAALVPLLERRDRVNIVLLADHGEGLGRRGVRYHGNFVFQELAHIPFLLRTVDVPVSSTGVFNLLRSLRGLEPDDEADPSPLLLLGATDVGQGPGFPAFDHMQWSLLYGRHRLLYMPRQQLVELYDVESDPFELKNQVDDNPELASNLLSRLVELHNQPQK